MVSFSVRSSTHGAYLKLVNLAYSCFVCWVYRREDHEESQLGGDFTLADHVLYPMLGYMTFIGIQNPETGDFIDYSYDLPAGSAPDICLCALSSWIYRIASKVGKITLLGSHWVFARRPDEACFSAFGNVYPWAIGLGQSISWSSVWSIPSAM